jgi:ATP phosphoribosyltransferase
MINFAIPDGHQMSHVLKFFDRIGFNYEGYQKGELNRRPKLKIASEQTKQIFNEPDSLYTKVVRPQDMPMHVASNNFDLAITGTDWLREHNVRFLNSPVEKIVNLGFGKVRIVAAIHESLPINSIDELRDFLNSFEPIHYFRIASEYAYIADNYARIHRLYKYRIIMTYGATESLIPEDAEMIIENTETGGTLRKNRLKIIDTIFESEGCLIAHKKSMEHRKKGKIIEAIKTVFEKNVAEKTNDQS